MGRPRNKHEGIVWDMLCNKKLSPLKTGYPDFIVELQKEHIIACIEVKAMEEYALSEEQEEMMHLLHKYGWECYRWSPQSGLTPLFPDDENILLQLLKGIETTPNLSLSHLLDWVDASNLPTTV